VDGMQAGQASRQAGSGWQGYFVANSYLYFLFDI
jgi:hypothetical protein